MKIGDTVVVTHGVFLNAQGTLESIGEDRAVVRFGSDDKTPTYSNGGIYVREAIRVAFDPESLRKAEPHEV